MQRTVAQIPWRGNLALLHKLDLPETRIWYARTYRRAPVRASGQRRHQFPADAAAVRLRSAAQAFKDPYLFDFLGTAEPRTERELEQGLVDHIERFLLEMGAGFAFVGSSSRPPPSTSKNGSAGTRSTPTTPRPSHRTTLGRTNEEEVVLTRYLRPALDSPNPGLPGEAVDNAIRAIVQVSDPGPERGGQPDAGTPRRKPSASSSSGASKQLTPFSHRGWISGHANSASEPPLTRCWLGRRLLDAHALGN